MKTRRIVELSETIVQLLEEAKKERKEISAAVGAQYALNNSRLELIVGDVRSIKQLLDDRCESTDKLIAMMDRNEDSKHGLLEGIEKRVETTHARIANIFNQFNTVKDAFHQLIQQESQLSSAVYSTLTSMNAKLAESNQKPKRKAKKKAKRRTSAGS